MPELPEVETIKRDLQRLAAGQCIQSVLVRDVRALFAPLTRSQKTAVVGRTIVRVERRGKAVILVLDKGWNIVVHPKMTGQLIYGSRMPESKIVFALSSGEYLNYNDHRLFGWVAFVRDLDTIPYLRTLGPDPLNGGFHWRWLLEKTATRRAPLKALLLDQHFIAGIGNIYASEILFRAGLSPFQSAASLDKAQAVRLCRHIRQTLREAVRLRGTSMNTYRDASGREGEFWAKIRVYGKKGTACPACGFPIHRAVLRGRSTFYCPRCQDVAPRHNGEKP